MEQRGTTAITFRLPAPLYERLRREAFDLRKPMNELVVEAVSARYPEPDNDLTPKETPA